MTVSDIFVALNGSLALAIFMILYCISKKTFRWIPVSALASSAIVYWMVYIYQTSIGSLDAMLGIFGAILFGEAALLCSVAAAIIYFAGKSKFGK